MSNDKYKTQVEIGVNDGPLRRMGAVLDKVFSSARLDKFTSAQKKITKELEKQAAVADKAMAASTAGAGGPARDSRGRFLPSGGGSAGGGGRGGGGRRGGGQGGGGAGGRQPLGFFGTSGAAGLGMWGANAMNRGMGGLSAMAGGEGMTASMLGGIPIAGGFLSAALQGAERLGSTAIGHGQEMAATAGITGLGDVSSKGLSGLTRYGIGRQQLPGRLAQLSQQSGMRGQDLKELAPEALRMEALTGISGGAMAGAAGTAGGQVSPKQAMALTRDAISSGMDAGFRDAKLGEFVSQMAGDIGQMRSRGIMVDPVSLPNLVGAFGKTGLSSLQGEAGAHAAKTLSDALGGAGQGGDFFSALAMRSYMDKTNPKTDKKYTAYEAQMALEENPEESSKMFLSQLSGMGGSDEAKAMFLKTQVPGLSSRQALQMVQGGSQIAGPQGIGKMANNYIAEQGMAEKGAFGLAAGEARLQNKRIGAGGRVAGRLQRMHGNEITIAETIGADLGADAGDKVAAKTAQYATAYKDGGVSGVLAEVGKDAAGMLSSVGDSISRAASEVVDQFKNIDWNKISDKISDALMDGFKALGGGTKSAGEGLAVDGKAMKTINKYDPFYQLADRLTNAIEALIRVITSSPGMGLSADGT